MCDKLQEGLSLFRKEYYGAVREYAEEYRQAIIDGEITDWETLDERIWQDVDGSQWIIYTWRAHCVLLASDNSDAFQDDPGIVDMTASNFIEQMAFWAMKRDIEEQLDAMGIDQDKLEAIENLPKFEVIKGVVDDEAITEWLKENAIEGDYECASDIRQAILDNEITL